MFPPSIIGESYSYAPSRGNNDISTQGNDLHMNYENIESVFHNVMYVEVLLLFLYLV